MTTDPKRRPEDEEDPAPAAAGEPAIPPETEEELDADEAEFRALRRDIPGAKGASAAGVVTIRVAKTPNKNEFFRTHPRFRPVVQIASLESGMDRHFLAVAPNMIEPLQSIGIHISDYTLYWTMDSKGAHCVVPVRLATGDRAQNEFEQSKEIGLIEGISVWVRLYTDLANGAYKVFPAPPDRYTSAPPWPELKESKVFRLAFRDKGRLLDSLEHVQFRIWAARDRDPT